MASRKQQAHRPQVDEDETFVTTDSAYELLGIPMSPADMLKVRCAVLISATIQKRGLTQKQAGELLGIDQPRVSKLMRGNLKLFALETLFEYLAVLGHDMSISIAPPRDNHRGRLKVA
jgi:predicted XRE-type DNA-binding protein